MFGPDLLGRDTRESFRVMEMICILIVMVVTWVYYTFVNTQQIVHLKCIFFFFLAVFGLRFCARAFSSCGERRLLFVEVRRLLIVMASLVAEHGF